MPVQLPSREIEPEGWLNKMMPIFSEVLLAGLGARVVSRRRHPELTRGLKFGRQRLKVPRTVRSMPLALRTR
jgi:hypothetical protein